MHAVHPVRSKRLPNTAIGSPDMIAERRTKGPHPARPKTARGHGPAVLLAAGVLVFGTAHAAGPTQDQTTPFVHPAMQVDMQAPSLRNQPFMSGMAAMVDADGELHVLCVDPDWSESALRHAHLAERQPAHPIRFE